MKLWLPSARRLRNWVLQVLGSFSSLLKTNHIQQRRRPPPNNTHPAGTQVLDAAIAITILLLLLLLLRYRSCTFWRCSTLAQVVTCTAYVITIQTIIEQKRNDGRLSLVWRRLVGDGSCWYDKKKKRGARNQSFNPHVFAAVASFLLGLWVVVFYYYCVRAHCTSCMYEKKEEEDSSSAPAVGWKKEKKILTSLKDSQREGQKNDNHGNRVNRDSSPFFLLPVARSFTPFIIRRVIQFVAVLYVSLHFFLSKLLFTMAEALLFIWSSTCQRILTRANHFFCSLLKWKRDQLQLAACLSIAAAQITVYRTVCVMFSEAASRLSTGRHIPR